MATKDRTTTSRQLNITRRFVAAHPDAYVHAVDVLDFEPTVLHWTVRRRGRMILHRVRIMADGVVVHTSLESDGLEGAMGQCASWLLCQR